MLGKSIFAFLVFIAMHTLALSACSAGGESSVVRSYNFLGTLLRDTLDNLRATVSPTRGIFIAGCTNRRASTETSETYVLIVPASSDPAVLLVLVARKNQSVVANVASLYRDRGAFAIEEALGGEWTYSRLQSIANSLKERPFRLLFDYPDSFATLTDSECPGIE